MYQEPVHLPFRRLRVGKVDAVRADVFSSKPFLVEIKGPGKCVAEDIDQEPEKWPEVVASLEILRIVATDSERSLAVRVEDEMPCKKV